MMLKRIKTILFAVMAVAFSLAIVCAVNLDKSTTFAEGATLNYGEISTSIQADTTLQYVAGISEDIDSFAHNGAFEPSNFETNRAMPNEKDGSAVSSGYALYIHPLYTSVTKNAIVFDTPISAEDMLKSGGLTIRIYVDVSTGDTFMIKGLPSDFSYGIYFYGLGATGAFTDHPVWLPAEIKQGEYVDFKINAYDASRLADASGNVRGLVVANRIGGWIGMSTDYFNIAKDPYIYIKSISLNAPDTTSVKAGEMEIYAGMGGLTHVSGYINDGNPSGGYNKYWDGYSPVDVVPGYRVYEQIDQLELDNGQTVDKAYRFTYHFSSVANVAKNSILFERPLTVADIENTNGITLRIFAHLTSDGSDYTRFNETYGLFFYGYGQGITGESDDVGVVIPANVAKDQWTDLYIPADVLKTMVGDNDVLYGLNYGARIDVVSEAMYKGNTATNPGYVLLSKVTLEEKEFSVTFKNGEDVVASDTLTKGSEIVMAQAPAINGKVFVGWETEGKLYSANSKIALVKDTTFNAIYVSFNMDKGAGIRLDQPTGIRFISRLSQNDYAALVELVGENNAKLGVKVVRQDGKSLEIVAQNTQIVGENIVFNGVITDLTEQYYNVQYTGTGYIDLYYADGTTGRIFANSNDNTRTIAQVASLALEEPDAYDYYTEEQYKLLESFVGVKEEI